MSAYSANEYEEALIRKRIECVKRLKAQLATEGSIAAETLALYNEAIEGKPTSHEDVNRLATAQMKGAILQKTCSDEKVIIRSKEVLVDNQHFAFARHDLTQRPTCRSYCGHHPRSPQSSQDWIIHLGERAERCL